MKAAPASAMRGAESQMQVLRGFTRKMMSVDEQRGLTSSGGPGRAGLAAQLSKLARSLQAEPDVVGTLAVTAAAAVSNVPGADYAVITLITSGGKVSTLAASDTVIEGVEDLQNQTNQGRCLSTAREQVTIRVNDLSTDGRWPLFACRAAGMGVRSMLSFHCSTARITCMR